MLQAALRTARPATLRLRTARPALRTLSTTALRRSDDGHHVAAPSVYGVGAKPGEIPTDEAQSTGLDRVQVLGNLAGVEVFDLDSLDASRIGTLADPIKVFSVPERVVGCSGSPAESHDLHWFNVSKDKPSRCLECGSAYIVDYLPDGPVVAEVAPQDASAHAHH
ncbi:COX5B-domain-containing protein [Auriscalpium vulgare]|uniref:COX5B-domain-containing protein n=1 Tax=Auriscalpium vulgare TaxID=40419 RepID=A0ACB8S0Z8_9AGAM|nr:COX5B-domain-containing protein [Auriscalpium vulgare]